MCSVNSVRIHKEYCILLALLLLPYAAGTIIFTSKYQGQTVTGLVGSSVNFTWSFTGGFHSVTWGLKKDGTNGFVANGELISLQKSGYVSVSVPPAYRGRVSGSRSGDSSSGQAIFTLRSITKDDERSFACRIDPESLIDNPIFDSVRLVVNELPKITLSSVPASYDEGSPVNISCTASGRPDPDVKWMKNVILKSSGKKTAFLTFNSINRADGEQYTCKANNSVGNDVKHTTLVVHYKPEGTTLTTSAANNTVTQGDTVTLTCHVTAAKPQVSQYRFYLNDSLAKASNDSQYTINNVQRSQHYGKYKCISHNDVGDGPETTVTLYVNDKPEGTTLTTSAANNTVTQGDTVTLTCHVTAAKQRVSQYRFYLNDTLVKATNDSQFTINNVQRFQHYGKYKCISHNDVGDGPEATAVTLYVNVPVQFTVIPQNVTINETNPIFVSCEASGFPAPSITWTKHGQGNPVRKEPNTQRSNINDAGMYVCTANNGVGQAKTATSYVIVQYPPTIQQDILPAVMSWIGQTVTLKCVSDGVPTPTLTWYKPDGSQISNSTATEYTVNVKMNVDQDFGNYKCNANNGLTPADVKIVNIKQIKKPSYPTITSSAADIQDTSLTVKWTPPTDNGGSPITSYRVVILKGGIQIKDINITDPGTTSRSVGGLERGTNYTVEVFARNAVFEGPAGEKAMKTNFEGVPATAEIYGLPSEVISYTVTLKWREPQNNGKVITQYTVYQRIVIDGKQGEWTRLETVTDISVRKLKIKLEKGKVYEFVVTATNQLGESSKEDGKIKRVLASGIPAAVEMSDIPSEVTESTITLKWSEPQNYGREITLYTVYQRIVTDGKPGDWDELKTITNVLVRELKVELEKGKEYEFVVTATNVHGESSRDEGNSKRVKAIGVISKQNRISPEVRNRCTGCGGELIVVNPMSLETEKQSSSMLPCDDAATYTVPSTGDHMPFHPSTRSWEINREQVEIIKVIGNGAFSQVAKATAWNISGNENYITVAVKMLKVNAPDSDRKDLLAEVELMKKMKPHPHVIKLIGCVTKTDPLLVLIEYVPFGDLLGYLRKSRGLSDTYFKDPDVKPVTPLTAEQLMKFAWQVADGMFYLSSRKIIHRDLAARNVLVGEGEKCKVTDFGMARNVHLDDIYTKQSWDRLPVKWTAYEALLYGTYTTQSDVWSYGILLYEILTVGGSPYPGIQARQIARKLQEGFRMPKPKHVDNKLYQIMLNCWEENPSDRPTFAKLKDTMKEMGRNHKMCVNLEQYDNSLYGKVEDLTDE